MGDLLADEHWSYDNQNDDILLVMWQEKSHVPRNYFYGSGNHSRSYPTLLNSGENGIAQRDACLLYLLWYVITKDFKNWPFLKPINMLYISALLSLFQLQNVLYIIINTCTFYVFRGWWFYQNCNGVYFLKR